MTTKTAYGIKELDLSLDIARRMGEICIGNRCSPDKNIYPSVQTWVVETGKMYPSVQFAALDIARRKG